MNFGLKDKSRETQAYKLLPLISIHDFLRSQTHQQWRDWCYFDLSSTKFASKEIQQMRLKSAVLQLAIIPTSKESLKDSK